MVKPPLLIRRQDREEGYETAIDFEPSMGARRYPARVPTHRLPQGTEKGKPSETTSP